MVIHRKKVLLTSLSPAPRPSEYFLNERTANANQSPLALIQLFSFEDMPENILILCTEKIKMKQFASAKEEILDRMRENGTQINDGDIRDLCIPDGKTTQELWEILKIILDNVPIGAELTLDITHGFRSFPFIFFTAAVFLKALRDVEIKAVYYGMLDVKNQSDQAPMVDLSLILDMVEWFYATRIFKETGQARHLNALLAKLTVLPEGIAEKDKPPYGKIKALRTALGDFANAYAQALPIELGLVSAQVVDKLPKIDFTDEMRKLIPVPDELMDVVKDFIEPFALPLATERDKKNKNIIPLDVSELERQATLIDSYLTLGYLNYALGTMREWMVSAVLMHNVVSKGTKTSWLDYNYDRRPIENRLNYLANIMETRGSEVEGLLTDGQSWLGLKWIFLRDKRNKLAHHGYCKDYSLQENITEVSSIWKELKESLDNQSLWQLELTRESPEGILLVSPLGLSQGLLYSALKHIKPSRAVIITSQQSSGNIEEIMGAAEWEGDFDILLMKEPFTGFDEAEDILRRVQPILGNHGEVVVNITGGTTAMQYIVQEVAESAARQQLPLKKAALVDRRPPTEQKSNPYVLGELVWLRN